MAVHASPRLHGSPVFEGSADCNGVCRPLRIICFRDDYPERSPVNIPPAARVPFEPYAISRPDKSLLWYYVLVSLAAGPFFPLVLIPLYFKYETLRYQFDAKGVSMSWGILFRRETVLTYRRIQDIHLTRNIVQRWMGLASVAVQTASGSAGAEMTLDGILDAEPLRDFLYAQMRGARGLDGPEPAGGHVGQATSPASGLASGQSEELLKVLSDIRDSLAQLAQRSGGTR